MRERAVQKFHYNLRRGASSARFTSRNMPIEPVLPIIPSKPKRLVLFIVSTAIKFCEMNLAKKIGLINCSIERLFM